MNDPPSCLFASNVEDSYAEPIVQVKEKSKALVGNKFEHIMSRYDTLVHQLEMR